MSFTTLIPAAGAGTRMRPLTTTLPKAMLPVAGKPILYHIVKAASDAGSKEIVIIVEYKKEYIIQKMPEFFPNLNFHFIEQGEMKGLGHACYKAKSLCEKNPLLIIYGDTLFDADLSKVVSSSIPMIGVKEVEDPRRFGIIEKDENEKVTRFVEKPENPSTNLAIPGVNFFPDGAALFSALEYILDNDIKTKGEYQITDAFQRMIEEGQSIGYFILNAWYDCGKHSDTLETNKVLLQKKGSIIEGDLTNCEVIDPVIIGADTFLEDCTVGPFVSIGIGNSIASSRIENSIIGDENQINNSKISTALIGNECKLTKVSGKMVIGDYTLVNEEQD